MLIHGERGKLGKGYSLKDNNGTGNWYVWVWNKDTYKNNAQKIKERRKHGLREEDKNYSKVDEWKIIGRYDDPSTLPALYGYLIDTYGIEFAMEDLQVYLKEKQEALEEKRLKELAETNRMIEKKSKLLDLKFREFRSVVRARKKNRMLDKLLNDLGIVS